MRRVRVKCILYVEVELPDDADEVFVIEENGCLGTGVVWPALRALVEAQERSDTCVMCSRGCENVIDKVLSK